MDNMQLYRDVFQRVFNVPASELNETFTFQDISRWDSVAHLNLISELEDTFDVMFEMQDILHFGSYLNGIEILKRYGVAF